MSNLFIPKRIRVGFQKREGTYTNKLAYVIYYDAKGKLRKETSWQSWRDDKIKAEEFENTPRDGFVLNKGIRRYNWSHFGSNRSYIRIYDTRGIEFEVTPENLIGLLMETNCSKRGLEGEFVYAWCGKELVLLPCSSEEYGEAVKNTERQGKKISARDLKPGCSYTTKKGEEVIYMGRFPWFTMSQYSYEQKSNTRTSKKRHIFAQVNEWRGHGKKPTQVEYTFLPKGDASFLAELNSEDPVQNYAALVDQFNGDVHSSVIEKWETKPLKPTESWLELKKDGYHSYLKRAHFTKMVDGVVIFWNMSVIRDSDDKVRGYKLKEDGALDTKTFKYESRGNYHYHVWSNNDDRGPVLSKKELFDRLAGCADIDMVLSSGKKVRLKNIGSIAPD